MKKKRLTKSPIVLDVEVIPSDPTQDRPSKSKKLNASSEGVQAMVVRNIAAGKTPMQVAKESGISHSQIEKILQRARISNSQGMSALKSEALKLALVATDEAGKVFNKLAPIQKVQAASIFISRVTDMEKAIPERATDQPVDFDALKRVGDALEEIRGHIDNEAIKD